MAFLKLKLFPRFLIYLTLIAVIPVALVGHIVVGINNESLQEEVQRYHLLLARSLAAKLDERLISLQSHLNIGISAIKDPSVNWIEKQKILTSLIDSSPYLVILSAVSSKGQEIIKTYNPQLAREIEENPTLISHQNLPLFQNFQQSGNQVAHVSRSGPNAFAEIYIPFDTPVGKNAVYVKVSFNDLCEIIEKESIGLTGYATFIGRDGELISEPRHAKVKDGKIVKDQSIVKTALTGSLEAREFTDESGKKWVGASAPVSKLGGAVITQQTREEAYASILEGKRQAALFVLMTIFLAAIAAYLLTRSLVRPLLAITKIAQEVDLASGQFPRSVAIQTNDEIQELARTFNDMIEKLKGYADLQVEKLIIEQKKTEAIIFSIQDGIVMTDYQGKIQLISHTAKNILQIPESQPILGEPLWKFLSSETLKTAFMNLLSGPDRKSLEVRLPREHKESVFSLTSRDVRSPDKEETLGIVTVLHDITLEKELDSMKEEFLHSITHDLRNPLTAIRGFIRLFQSGQTGAMSELQTKMLETMDKASLRLLNMVNDILDLARLEADRLTLHLEPFRVDEAAGRIVDLFLPQTKNNRVNLKMEVVGEKPPPLNADPNLFERVLTNLIGNATKFTPDDGSITLRIENFDDRVQFTVADTGPGIPASYLERVFDKFRQVESNYKGGAGLGLTICKRIVEAHKGRIWVESEVDKGASFIFYIPRNLEPVVDKKAA